MVAFVPGSIGANRGAALTSRVAQSRVLEESLGVEILRARSMRALMLMLPI
jgi:hypothetical protein